MHEHFILNMNIVDYVYPQLFMIQKDILSQACAFAFLKYNMSFERVDLVNN